MPSPGYTIDAVDRALALLESLRALGPAPMAELAAHAGCTRSAAFRLLRTLQARGFAVQDEERGAWRLGPRLTGLGESAKHQGALATATAPALRQAALDLNEHIYLLQPEAAGTEVEVIALYPARDQLRRYAEVGARLPVHAGPCRLLLAHAAPALQSRALAGSLVRVAPHTRLDRAWHLADLPRTRLRISLVTQQELFENSTELAAALRDANGRVCAVLMIASPAYRLRAGRQRDLLAALRGLAAQIEAATLR